MNRVDFIKLAHKRVPIRKYLEQKVEKEKLQKILDAAKVAPVVVNTLPPKIIVIQEKEDFANLAKGAPAYGAPIALLVCAEQNPVWRRPSDGKFMGEVDASIAADYMALQATELDLGTCWFCHFNAGVIKKEFNLPENLEPVNILFLGYAADEQEEFNGYLESCITDAVF